MESGTAQYPVNQLIVAGEPVVSWNQRSKWIEQKYTIHAEVIGQTMLLLLLCKFTILCKGVRDGRLGRSGGTGGLVRLVIRVLLLLLRFTDGGLQLTVGILGLLVKFVVIGLIGLVRMGFLTVIQHDHAKAQICPFCLLNPANLCKTN